MMPKLLGEFAYGTFVSQVFVHMFNVLITYATIFYLNMLAWSSYVSFDSVLFFGKKFMEKNQ